MNCKKDYCEILREAGCADPDLIDVVGPGSNKKLRRMRLEAQEKAREEIRKVCRICQIAQGAADKFYADNARLP